MAIPSPTNTYVSYNGWTFYAPRLKWSWDIQPVQNESKTYIVGTQYTLTLRAIVTNDSLGVSAGTSASDTPGANLDDMMYALNRPGGQLIVRGLGWDQNVNTAGSANDLMFGPWTQTLTVTPIGGILTVEVLWKVLWVVGCTQMIDGIDYVDAYTEGTTMVDELGLTTRTVSGIIRAYSRFNSGSVTGDAERLYDNVVVSIPTGFRRVDRSWKVDSAQNTCQFSFTDKELPSVLAPIPGTIHSTFQHSINSSGMGPSVGVQITHNFKISVNIPKGGSAIEAFNHLIYIVGVRLNKVRDAGFNPLITGFSIEENDIFNTKGFSANLSFLVNRKANNIGEVDVPFGVIPDSGMFSLANLDSYRSESGAWAAGMDEAKLLDNRGPTSITTDFPKLIYGSCNTTSGGITVSEIGQYVPQKLESSLNALIAGCPDEENSYFHTSYNWSTHSSAGGVVARTNPPSNSGAATNQYQSRDTITDPVTYISGIGPVGVPHSPDTDDMVAYGSVNPFIRVYYSGVTVRIGFPPELPPADQVFIDAHNQGRTAEFSRWTDIKTMDMFGCKVYILRWNIGHWVEPELYKQLSTDGIQDQGFQQ